MSTKTGCVLCLEGFDDDTDAERPIVFNEGGTDLGASNSGREVNIQGVEGSTATTDTWTGPISVSFSRCLVHAKQTAVSC